MYQQLCCVSLTLVVLLSKVAFAAPIELGPYTTIRAKNAFIKNGDSIQPVSVSLYNGDGLTSDNPLYAEHESDPTTVWQQELSASDEFPISIEFELDGEFQVSEMWVWQFTGEGDRGVASFDVILRDSTGAAVGVIDSADDKLRAKGVQPAARFNAFGECVFLPFPVFVTSIELRIKNNLGDPDFVGLSEVLFVGRQKLVPEPCSTSLLLIGLVLLCTRFDSVAEARKLQYRCS